MWYNGLWNIPIDLNGVKNKRKLAEFKNLQAFQIVFMRFMNDALRRYDFEGLPETISKRVVLQSLVWHANVCFFEKGGNLFALPCAPSGSLNIYGEPGQAEVFSVNGMLNENVNLFIHGSDEDSFLKKTDEIATGKERGVIVWENKQRFPFVNSVIYYAQAVADAMRTLDVIKANLKQPNVIVAEEAVVPTVKQYLRDREMNMDSVISSGVFDAKKVSIMPYDAKGASLNDVTALVEWYEAKFRELCGVDNNSQMDKKGENLIQAEVSVNDQYTDLSVDKCLETIQECLDDVNKIFGVNIRVKEVANEQENDVRGNDSSGQSDVSGDSGHSSETDDI